MLRERTDRPEDDLKGKTVATQSASGTAEDYVDGHKDTTGYKDVKKYADYLSAFMDLENGRVDAIVCDEIIGRFGPCWTPPTSSPG